MPFWCKIDLVSFELKFCLLLRIKLRIARHLAIGNCILSSPGKISPDLTAIFRFLTAIFLKHLKFDVVKFPAKFEFFKFDISRANFRARSAQLILNLKSPAQFWIWNIFPAKFRIWNLPPNYEFEFWAGRVLSMPWGTAFYELSMVRTFLSWQFWACCRKLHSMSSLWCGHFWAGRESSDFT